MMGVCNDPQLYQSQNSQYATFDWLVTIDKIFVTSNLKLPLPPPPMPNFS